jgi:aminoglycoside phosphotransferase
MRAVVGIVAGQSGLVIGLSLILLPGSGAAGVGLAWLLASTAIASVILVNDHRGAATGTTPAGIVRDVAADLGALRALQWVRAFVPHRRRMRRAAEVTAVLANTPWTPGRPLRTVTDMAVLTAGPPGGPPCVIVKCATSPAAARSLEAELRALAALTADPRLEGWRRLLPVVVGHGEQAGVRFLVEELFPGRTATHAMSSPDMRRSLVRHAAAAIGGLHRATAAEQRIDEDRLRRWVDEPLATLRRDGDGPALISDAAERTIADQLREALLGRRTAVSWVHGDYALGNILATPQGARVTGIVDWEVARPGDLPLIDVVTLLLATRMHAARRELGRIVCDWLAGARWTPFEHEVIDGASSALPGRPVDADALVLLAWLQQIAGSVAKAPRYATHELWRRSNVDPVARAVVRAR